MNANELADIVDHWAWKESAEYLTDAATMLRQQQAEIEALKQIIDANNLNQNIGQFVKPTNEPVAWMTHLIRYDNLAGKIAIPQLHLTRPPTPLYDDLIPLYTHPVKELTDEEIDDIGRQHLTDGDGAIEFARAILRKAQENG